MIDAAEGDGRDGRGGLPHQHHHHPTAPHWVAHRGSPVTGAANEEGSVDDGGDCDGSGGGGSDC